MCDDRSRQTLFVYLYVRMRRDSFKFECIKFVTQFPYGKKRKKKKTRKKTANGIYACVYFVDSMVALDHFSVWKKRIYEYNFAMK